MLRRFGHLLVISALLAGIGGHWAILQSIAWATMLTDNLQRTNVLQAVSDTFDGEHPCTMCQAIKLGRAAEQPQDQGLVKPGFKLELSLVPPTAIFIRTQPREWISSAEFQFTSSREGPPKPRPRTLSSTFCS